MSWSEINAWFYDNQIIRKKGRNVNELWQDICYEITNNKLKIPCRTNFSNTAIHLYVRKFNLANEQLN
jgi:hypothetical protein